MKQLILLMICAITLASCNKEPENRHSLYPKLDGPYLGQTPPGDEPVIFAPDVINSGMFTRDIAMTPDGKEIYFSVCMPEFSYSTIMVTKHMNHRWANPEVAWFATNSKYKYIEPCISPDGKFFYFVSNQHIDTTQEARHFDIWVMKRLDTDWTNPKNLEGPVNSDADEFFPSVTNDGTIYFTREIAGEKGVIMRSKYVNEKYQKPELLPENVNCGAMRFNSFVAPDESYLIQGVFGMNDSRGRTDYYIIFRNPDDTWSKPVNMGDKVNTEGGQEYSPFVSRDGKYFFFMSPRLNPKLIKKGERFTSNKLEKWYNSPGNGNPCIYWMDASFIKKLKP